MERWGYRRTPKSTDRKMQLTLVVMILDSKENAKSALGRLLRRHFPVDSGVVLQER